MNWLEVTLIDPKAGPFLPLLFRCEGCGFNRLPLYLGRNAEGNMTTLRCSTCRPN